jgi:hypothetical protein
VAGTRLGLTRLCSLRSFLVSFSFDLFSFLVCFVGALLYICVCFALVRRASASVRVAVLPLLALQCHPAVLSLRLADHTHEHA